ncbi:type II toxin-antitoxin system prevent-host-death family antitoxin [Streptomyces sp. NPDC057565]|uniref:type II toxin-antitoxin system prevent-host-death family antitoxin n=1 Tax=Streptomyces sp. NPDC057565 TaxID=3346169 RepID=UPI00367AFA4E
MERMGVRELRDQLGRQVDEAHYRGTHTVVEKNGEPRAVLVPYDWWSARSDEAPETD